MCCLGYMTWSSVTPHESARPSESAIVGRRERCVFMNEGLAFSGGIQACISVPFRLCSDVTLGEGRSNLSVYPLGFILNWKVQTLEKPSPADKFPECSMLWSFSGPSSPPTCLIMDSRSFCYRLLTLSMFTFGVRSFHFICAFILSW